jgi:hypothetical protein
MYMEILVEELDPAPVPLKKTGIKSRNLFIKNLPEAI